MIHKLARIIFLPIILLCTPVQVFCADYCFQEAASMYDVPADLLVAISSYESRNNPNAINWNKNGTYDFCHMQINSSWYQDLGPELWDSLDDPCQCSKVGAWILARCIQRHGYNWKAIGCYHAGSRSEKEIKRINYAWDIYRSLRNLRRNESGSRLKRF